MDFKPSMIPVGEATEIDWDDRDAISDPAMEMISFLLLWGLVVVAALAAVVWWWHA